ncbi:hypothetical protein AYI70_g7074 [Smittium culicis]|uniref:Uncharacterized protein n=1 Tax=Smittium culicis TaxID=133412 RepID=A0A1R1X7E9_9FUNG|nr:hypothetical protein AYI70_g10245 [Smittium culicis]OMJ15711.1 hypothetical protein AYI70_g7074 [Smittium culicis]
MAKNLHFRSKNELISNLESLILQNIISNSRIDLESDFLFIEYPSTIINSSSNNQDPLDSKSQSDNLDLKLDSVKNQISKSRSDCVYYSISNIRTLSLNNKACLMRLNLSKDNLLYSRRRYENDPWNQ